MTRVLFQRLEGFDPNVPLPRYETRQAAGMDIRANLLNRTSTKLHPGESVLISTGLAMALLEGFEAQVRPRSGLALKHAVTLTNSPGTIDADYRGPVGVIMINHGRTPFVIEHGSRIAQLVIAPIIQAEVLEVEELDRTERGKGGFGSTGVG